MDDACHEAEYQAPGMKQGQWVADDTFLGQGHVIPCQKGIVDDVPNQVIYNYARK